MRENENPCVRCKKRSGCPLVCYPLKDYRKAIRRRNKRIKMHNRREELIYRG